LSYPSADPEQPAQPQPTQNTDQNPEKFDPLAILTQVAVSADFHICPLTG
jgi:hypothetical protein